MRRPSGWYFSDLEGSQCEDSTADLPDNVGYREEADLDNSSAPADVGVAIDAVPGLLEYEAILSEENSIESDDLVLVVPDPGTSETDDTAMSAVEDNIAPSRQNGVGYSEEAALQGQLSDYEDDDDDMISSSPSGPDSAVDEVEPDAESAAPPMAASTPVKDEIELFPRVRVVPGYYTSPGYAPRQTAPRTMPKLLPVSSVKRRLNLDETSPSEGRPRLPVAPPSTPTIPGEPLPRRRRLELNLDPTVVNPGRRLTRRLLESVREAAAVSSAGTTPLRQADDLSWASLSSVHQSCTPSRFERDSPLSPSPEKRALQSEESSGSEEQIWGSLSPVQQSCTPSRFERDSPLSPSPEKSRSTARETASDREPSEPSSSRAVGAQAWAQPSPVNQSCNPSRVERNAPLSPSQSHGMPTASAFEEVQMSVSSASNQSSLLSDGSARLGTSLTRSQRTRAYLESSERSDASMTSLRQVRLACDTQQALLGRAGALRARIAAASPSSRRRLQRHAFPEPAAQEETPVPLAGSGSGPSTVAVPAGPRRSASDRPGDRPAAITALLFAPQQRQPHAGPQVMAAPLAVVISTTV